MELQRLGWGCVLCSRTHCAASLFAQMERLQNQHVHIVRYVAYVGDAKGARAFLQGVGAGDLHDFIAHTPARR